jgi:hypothetical protein
MDKIKVRKKIPNHAKSKIHKDKTKYNRRNENSTTNPG